MKIVLLFVVFIVFFIGCSMDTEVTFEDALQPYIDQYGTDYTIEEGAFTNIVTFNLFDRIHTVAFNYDYYGWSYSWDSELLDSDVWVDKEYDYNYITESLYSDMLNIIFQDGVIEDGEIIDFIKN